MGLGQTLVLRDLIVGRLGLAGPLLHQGLGVPDILLGGRPAAFERLEILLGRLGQVLVRGEIEHQGHDDGDRRDQGRRKSDQDRPMVFVRVQAASIKSRAWIGKRRRVRGRQWRGIPSPSRRNRLLDYRAGARNRFARCIGTEVAKRTMGRLGAIRALGLGLPRVTGGTAARCCGVIGIIGIGILGIRVIVVRRELGLVSGVVAIMLVAVTVGPIVRRGGGAAARWMGDRRRGDAMFRRPRHRKTNAQRRRLTLCASGARALREAPHRSGGGGRHDVRDRVGATAPSLGHRLATALRSDRFGPPSCPTGRRRRTRATCSHPWIRGHDFSLLEICVVYCHQNCATRERSIFGVR